MQGQGRRNSMRKPHVRQNMTNGRDKRLEGSSPQRLEGSWISVILLTALGVPEGLSGRGLYAQICMSKRSA